ncbi:hypothetical protein D3C72_1746470 [compost metagenome]
MLASQSNLVLPSTEVVSASITSEDLNVPSLWLADEERHMHSTLFHQAMALTLAATAMALCHAQELPLQAPRRSANRPGSFPVASARKTWRA